MNTNQNILLHLQFSAMELGYQKITSIVQLNTELSTEWSLNTEAICFSGFFLQCWLRGGKLNVVNK